MESNTSLSTSWNAAKHESGITIAEEILSLGVSAIEAGHTLNRRQVDDIIKLVEEGSIRVNSVHNFCPASNGTDVTESRENSLSALDEKERKEAVEKTIRTLETAEKLHAKVLVLHLGGVGMKTKIAATVRQLVLNGQIGTEEHRQAVKTFKEERANLAKPYLDAARKSLEEIIKKLPKGIILGFENRYNFGEIPSIDENLQLLNEFKGYTGYWHDIGHAHVLEYMGYYEKNEFINRLGKYLIGLHLHDAVGIHDHKAPGLGEIDFDSVIPFLSENVLRVLELNSSNTKEEVENGIRFLQEKGII